MDAKKFAANNGSSGVVGENLVYAKVMRKVVFFLSRVLTQKKPAMGKKKVRF